MEPETGNEQWAALMAENVKKADEYGKGVSLVFVAESNVYYKVTVERVDHVE